MDKQKHLLNSLLVILALFVVGALFMYFISSKVEEVRIEKERLIQENELLQYKISKKRTFYEEIENKISDIQTLMNQEDYHDDAQIKKFLHSLTLAQKKVIIARIPSGYPSSARRISSTFGYRIHPIKKIKKFHYGLDFAGKLGIPIRATADGIIEFSGFNKGGYGNLVIIHHNFGFVTAYGHMTDNLQVKSGDFVKKGAVIGYLGNSGLSTGPHLHYEIKFIKRVLDPQCFVSLGQDNFASRALLEKKVNWSALIDAILSTLKDPMHLKK